MTLTTQKQSIVKSLFDSQQDLVNHFFDQLDSEESERFFQALLECEGVILFSGVGKSGIVAQKVATTLVSTGTRALTVNPTDALHGDLGIVTDKDVLVLISKSGESDELLQLVPFARSKGAKILGMVSNRESRVARACDLVAVLPVAKELCPFDLAPTTSAAVQLIFGDVMAVALMRAKGFSREQYARNHPAGRIGKRITIRVFDLMLSGDSLPVCRAEDLLADTLVELSDKRCGCLLVVDDQGRLLGIFTDGDLRRALQTDGGEVLQRRMGDLMTPSAKWTNPKEMAWDAMQLMESDQQRPITVLPVLDGVRLVGLVRMHDLVQAGI